MRLSGLIEICGDGADHGCTGSTARNLRVERISCRCRNFQPGERQDYPGSMIGEVGSSDPASFFVLAGDAFASGSATAWRILR